MPTEPRPFAKPSRLIEDRRLTTSTSISSAIATSIKPPAPLLIFPPVLLIIIVKLASSRSNASMPSRPFVNCDPLSFDNASTAKVNKPIAALNSSNSPAIPAILLGPPANLSINFIDVINSANMAVIAAIATVNLPESTNDKAIREPARIAIARAIVISVLALTELCHCSRLDLAVLRIPFKLPIIPVALLKVPAPLSTNFFIESNKVAKIPVFRISNPLLKLAPLSLFRMPLMPSPIALPTTSIKSPMIGAASLIRLQIPPNILFRKSAAF